MNDTPGRFAREIERLMSEHMPAMSINDLAGELGLTYEFVRKLVRGLNLPTQGSVILLSKIFKVPVEQIEDWVKEAKLGSLVGNDVAALMFNPETKALVSGLAELDDAQKREVLSLVLKYVKANARQKTKH